jgi:hypothetical protein
MDSTDASGNDMDKMMGGRRRRRNNMTMRKRRNNMMGGSDDLVVDASGNEMMSGGKRRRNNSTLRKRRNNNAAMMGGAKVTVGTKAQVYHGTAKHTSGGLTKKDLMKTKKGRIVSKKKHAAGQKAIKKLKKLGYVAKKGTFKLFKKQ